MQDNEQTTAELVAALQATVTELRDGQDALLGMYEELRRFYPENCHCAQLSERAQAAFLAADPFTREYPQEDYVPDG